MLNPKNNARGGRQEELENQPNILAEEQDMEDELEENVGAVQRKVTMEEYAGAEKAFNDLVASEEEFETLPFRPGKNAKYVLTDYQKGVLQSGIDQIGNYLREEDKAKEFTGEDNKRLRDLHEGMKKIVKDGLDSLSPEERKTVDEFSAIMDGGYHHDSAPGVDTIIKHMRETAGTNVSLRKLHSGLDMLGVVTGNPATYGIPPRGDAGKRIPGILRPDQQRPQGEGGLRRPHQSRPVHSEPAEELRAGGTEEG